MDGMTPGEDRNNVVAAIVDQYHMLEPRIPKLPVDSCQCGLLANVAADGIMPVVEKIRETAYAAGYAEAVARLRNDDRYRDWWTATPERSFGTAYWAPDGRRHLADYLETVGVDQ